MQADWRRLAARAIQLLAIVFLMAAAGFHALGNYNHNDHMYAVAPVFAVDHRAYSDFAYVQTPLSLVLFTEIYRLAGAEALYTILRSVSLVLNFAILCIGIFLACRFTKEKLFAALVFATLYLSLGPTEGIGAEIGNYTLALFLFALSLICFDLLKAKNYAALLVGILAGLSVSAKISYVYMLPAYGVLYVFAGWRERQKLARDLALYCAGVLAGLLPILFYLHADSKSFLFENVYIHYLTNIYRGISPFSHSSQLPLFAFKSALIPVGLFAAAIAVVVAFGKTRISSLTKLKLPRRELEILLLFGAALLGAVTPSIIFPQYLAAPAFLLILLICIWMDRLLTGARRSRSALTILTAIVLLCCAVRGAGYIRDANARLRESTYGISAVASFRHALSERFAAIDRNSPGCHGDLISAFAVPAVGSGVKLSLVDSAGPFLMRLDGVFAAHAPDFRRFSDVRRYLSPRSLALSGFYGDDSYEPSSPFERIIENYVKAPGFKAIDMGRFMNRPITLYVPARCRL